MIDNSRSSVIFDPTKLRENIHIIGVGATGSHVVKDLVKLGIAGRYINVYDFDKIESHNIGNQLQRITNVGNYKVDSLQQDILEETGVKIQAHRAKINKDEASKMKGYVFLLVDTFEARRDILNGLAFNGNIKCLFEGGLGAWHCIARTLNVMSYGHVKFLNENWGSDDDPVDPDEPRNACGGHQVVKFTVELLSALFVSQFVQIIMDRKPLGVEVRATLKPSIFVVENNIK